MRDNNNQEMEITFDTGFDTLGNKILENQKNKGETVWEKYQRRKKEIRHDRRSKKEEEDVIE